jgi:hypothetical protein
MTNGKPQRAEPPSIGSGHSVLFRGIAEKGGNAAVENLVTHFIDQIKRPSDIEQGSIALLRGAA